MDGSSVATSFALLNLHFRFTVHTIGISLRQRGSVVSVNNYLNVLNWSSIVFFYQMAGLGEI